MRSKCSPSARTQVTRQQHVQRDRAEQLTRHFSSSMYNLKMNMYN